MVIPLNRPLGAAGRPGRRRSTPPSPTWSTAAPRSTLWAGDHTLWQDDPTEVADRLGWLPVVADDGGPSSPGSTGSLTAELAADGSTTWWCRHGRLEPVPRGAGPHLRAGRARPPRARTCSTPPIRPPSPGSARAGRSTRTLFVAASKSGTTIETRSHLAALLGSAPAARRRFAVDHRSRQRRSPTLAAERGFRAIVREPARHRRPLLGAVAVRPRARRPRRRRRRRPARRPPRRRPSSAATADARTNPGLRLAAAWPPACRAGRDKLTFVVDPRDRHLRAVARAADRRVDRQARHRRRARRRRAARPARRLRRRPAVRRPSASADRPAPRRPRRRRPPGASSSPTADRTTSARQVLLWELATALCRRRCSASTPSTSPTWPRPRRPPARCSTPAPCPTIEHGTACRRPARQVRPGDYLAIQAFVDPASPAPSTRSRRPAVRAPRPAAGGDDRRARAPVPALDRPAPQGRARRPACSSRCVGGRPERRRHPRAAVRVRHARSGRRPPATCATLPRPRPAAPAACALDELLRRRTPMKLGMVGLGKMGGNMAERLRRGGHEVVGYDAFAADGSDVAVARRRGRRRSATRTAGRVGDGAGRASRPSRWSTTSPGCSAPGDLVIDGGNSNFRDSMPAAPSWRSAASASSTAARQRRRVGPRERLLPDGRRDAPRTSPGPSPIFDALAAGGRLRPRRARSAPGTSRRWSTTASSTG